MSIVFIRSLFIAVIIFLAVLQFIGVSIGSRGRFRLPLMLSVIVLIWGSVILIVGGISKFDVDPTATRPVSILASSMLVAVFVVVLTTILGNFLSGMIARRYALSVADALATVIAGVSASVLMPLATLYLFLTSEPMISTFREVSTGTGIPFRAFLNNFLLLATATGVSSYMLMGFGTVYVLRERKAMIVGRVSVAISVFYSFLLALASAQIAQVPQNDGGNVVMFYVLVASYCTVMIGFFIAGFTVKILDNLIVLFYFMLILLAISIYLFGWVAGYRSVLQGEYIGVNPFFDAMILVSLGILLAHSRMLTSLVVEALVWVLAFGFVLALLNYEVNEPGYILLLIIFGSYAYFVRRMGAILRDMTHGSTITLALFVVSLILLPISAAFG